MAAILNSAILNLAILDSAILVFSLKFTHTCQDWFPPFVQKNFTHSFWLNLMMAAILNSTLLNLTILDSAILVFPFKLTHICQDWFPLFPQKHFTHSFWLNLMMAAILNSAMLDWDIAILDSDILLPFSDSLKNTLTPLWLWLKLIQSDSNSFILTLLDDGSQHKFCHVRFILLPRKKTSIFHSHSTWWWQPSWILPFWLQPFCTKKISLFHFDLTWWWQPSWISLSWIWPWWIQPFCTKLTQTNLIWLKLIHSHSNWWLQPSWILPCWIQTLPSWIQTTCYLLSDSFKNTLTPLWLWLKLIQSDLNSFIFT